MKKKLEKNLKNKKQWEAAIKANEENPDWDNDGIPNFIDPEPGNPPRKAKVKSKASKINSGANR